MNRLTYKEVYEDYKNEEKTCYNVVPTSNVSHQDCLNKLGQLEDIEEELGVDLITKHKIETSLDHGNMVYSKESGSYVMVTDKHSKYLTADVLNEIYKDAKIDKLIVYLPYKDYGKTWALTREELEK